MTFRLTDSIPEAVARRWEAERAAWYQEHGVDPAWATSIPERLYEALLAIPMADRIAFQHSQQHKFLMELDQCHGSCVLDDAQAPVCEALRHFHGGRVWIGDYTVMPNHVHVLVQPFHGVVLEEWLYSVKRYSATRILQDPALAERLRLRCGHLWQTESFDRVVRESSELARTRRYIAKNPAKLRPGTFALEQMDWLDEFAPRPPFPVQPDLSP